MAISFVGQAAAASTSVTTPVHQVGDIIIIFAYKNTTIAPTLPAGYTSITSTTGNNNAFNLGYKIATATNDSSGTWTGANVVNCVVYRGVSRVGAKAGQNNANGSTAAIPGLGLQLTDGSSWAVAGAGSRQTTSQGTPLAGATQSRGTQTGTTSDTIIADSNGGVTSFSSTTSANGSSVTSVGWAIELVAIGPSISTLSDNFSTNDQATVWPYAFSSAATYAITGGQLVSTLAGGNAGSNYAGLISKAYNLTGSSAYVQLVQAPNQATLADAIFYLSLDANNTLTWVEEGGTLFAQYIVGGSKNNAGTLTYTGNEALYAWLSMREGAGNGLTGSSGTTYWDTSVDGNTWTNRFSIANPITLTALQVNLTGGTFQSETSPGQVIFDNFNTPPAGIVGKDVGPLNNNFGAMISQAVNRAGTY